MATRRTPGTRNIIDRWHDRDGNPTARDGKGLQYQARYVDPNGREVGKSFPTKKAATVWLNAQTAAAATGGYIAPTKAAITFGQVEARWREGLSGLRPSTIAAYSEQIDARVLPVWKDTPVQAIKRRDVEQWLRGLRKKPTASQRKNGEPGDPVSAATATHALKLVRQIFAVALDPSDPIITVDPTSGVKVAKATATSGRERFASPEEVERVAKAADWLASQPKRPGRRTDREAPADRTETTGSAPVDWAREDVPVSGDGLLIRLLGATGCRFGEMAALRVGRLDLDPEPGRAPSLFVREAAVEVNGVMHVGLPKTTESIRRVPFRRSLVEPLRTHLEHAGILDDDAAFVFSQSDGGALRLRNWSKRVFRPAVALAGVDLNVHGLRHSAATAAIREGMTPVQVARILGHSKPSITLDIYSHEWPDNLTAIGEDD
ncbi:tyrosine-type recombinase/integrase [Tsukamurella asaccharolytica]|nr:site-specific integrase [Tsukamurella asaccharolytica]